MNAVGVDGAPNGWAAVIYKEGSMRVRRVARLADIFEHSPYPDIVALDVPIGLLDAYDIGGRECDRKARRDLQKRRSSVFVPPVRACLNAETYEEAKALSRASSRHNRALPRQTWEIIRKIKEADELLQMNPQLRPIVREVHPEVCFLQLVGHPMKFAKRKPAGRAERRNALARVFDVNVILAQGQSERLPIEDVLDALASCWSAIRLAKRKGRSLAADEKTI